MSKQQCYMCYELPCGKEIYTAYSYRKERNIFKYMSLIKFGFFSFNPKQE